jgi:hypothetical protein
MKINITAFLLATGLNFAPTFVNAQTVAAKINSKVNDETGKPADAATVSLNRLSDSVTIKSALVNPEGNFTFTGLKFGSYRIVISSIGRITVRSAAIVIDAQHQQVQLPVIIMQSANKALKEVVITSQKSFLEQKIDRTVVNVDALISNAGYNREQVLILKNTSALFPNAKSFLNNVKEMPGIKAGTMTSCLPTSINNYTLVYGKDAALSKDQTIALARYRESQ